jgi:hypothetical protein
VNKINEELRGEMISKMAGNQSPEKYSIERQGELISVRKMLNDDLVCEALLSIMLELERAEEKHPVWPVDLVHAVGIMAGEAGECLKAANHYREGRQTEGKDSLLSVEYEAVQTGAMALRLLINLKIGKE